MLPWAWTFNILNVTHNARHQNMSILPFDRKVILEPFEHKNANPQDATQA